MLNLIRLIALYMLAGPLSAQDISTSAREFTPVDQMLAADWYDVEEINRTWRHALVRRPAPDKGITKSSIKALANEHYAGVKYPVVIYLHGCSGLWAGSIKRMEMLAAAGYAAIAPDSFARNKYPKSCDPVTKTGGLYRSTLMMRQQDALNAVTRAKQLAWVDANNVFLLGFSEGGITAAMMRGNTPQQHVNARIIEGWTCHAGWPEYQGLRAPVSEPVMSLVAKHDPWFQADWARGECGAFMHPDNTSVSIQIKDGSLAHQHGLLEAPALQSKVLAFLHTHTH